jgi:hypothetical protein
MPDHALYYPEWGISNPVFMAESLLYWDRLTCIVPPNRKPMPWHSDKEMQKILEEAHEQFVSPLVPSEDQKERAHTRIMAFAELDPPEWCRPENLGRNRVNEDLTILAGDKLSYDTVDMLRQKGWIAKLPGSLRKEYTHEEYWTLHYPIANLILGVLADECASSTMPKVTDKNDLFTANCNLLLQELGASTGITEENHRPPQQTDVEGELAFLLTKVPHLSLRPGDMNAGVLRRILSARRDSSIDMQRQMLKKKIDEYLQKLRAVEKPEWQVISDQFVGEITRDQTDLRRELRRVRIESIISKEGLVATLVGLITASINPGIGLIIGFAGQAVNYYNKRQEVFNKHWSSWMFSMTGNQWTVW